MSFFQNEDPKKVLLSSNWFNFVLAVDHISCPFVQTTAKQVMQTFWKVNCPKEGKFRCSVIKHWKHYIKLLNERTHQNFDWKTKSWKWKTTRPNLCLVFWQITDQSGISCKLRTIKTVYHLSKPIEGKFLSCQRVGFGRERSTNPCKADQQVSFKKYINKSRVYSRRYFIWKGCHFIQIISTTDSPGIACMQLE